MPICSPWAFYNARFDLFNEQYKKLLIQETVLSGYTGEKSRINWHMRTKYVDDVMTLLHSRLSQETLLVC